MAFKNRVRLPFYLTRPQLPDERNVFRLADGSVKISSIVQRKTFEGETDYMPIELHERLKIALSHDEVTIEGQRYLGGVALDGDYSIAWQNFRDYPLGKGDFKVQVSPYPFNNDNCQSCEQASQLDLQDDTITGAYDSISEGGSATYNVFQNDTICCKPVVAEITQINDDYIETASINEFGILNITLHATTPTQNNVDLLTYRVTCPDGSYDEAHVFANVSGSLEVCQPPGSIDTGTITQTEATPNWFDIPTPAPVSYNWKLTFKENTITVLRSGNTTDTSVFLEDLESGACYTFFVQSVCEDDSLSDFISIDICTPVADVQCGKYLVTYEGTEPLHIFSYVNCSGNNQNDFIVPNQTKTICALDVTPGTPVSITGVDSYTYDGTC